jgi:hypothetical protein
MKTLVVAVALGVALVVTAPAGAQSNKAPTLRSLQAQITTLKKQVRALQKRVKNNENLTLGTLGYAGCSFAVTADALQGTWTTVDARVTTPPAFGAQTPVEDYGLCQAFDIVRQRNQKPPNVSVFQAMLSIFNPASAAWQQRATNFAGQAHDLFGPLVLPLQ